jgi:hypothetical protein
VKRRAPLRLPPLPDLSRILEDSRSHRREKRIHTRFDKVFLVVIGSELYGDSVAIARNVSAGGILVEMTYAPPLGTVVTVHFQHAHDDERVDEIVARAEVKHHHYLNFTGSGEAASTRAIGLRFLEFVELGGDGGDGGGGGRARVDSHLVH